MNTYREASQFWHGLPDGADCTTVELMNKLNKKDERDRRIVSSFLSTVTRKGLAFKNGKRAGLTVYTKGKVEPQLDRSFSLLELGQATFAVVDNLKTTITDLRRELKDTKADFKAALEREKELEKLIREKDERILSLNQAGGNRSFKLSDLKEFRDSLPES